MCVLFVDGEGICVVLDSSAKFKEWTMQGVQKTCKSKKDKYKWLYNTNKLTT